MTRRIVSLLLMPMLLVSQGLCFGHSHQGDSVTEQEGHDARPHFHLHGCGHQHHGDHDHDDAKHQSEAHQRHDKVEILTGYLPVAPHDDDAVYVAATVMLPTIRSVAADAVGKFWLETPFAKVVASDVVVSHLSGILSSLPPPIVSACPLYLRTLSLRC